MKGVNKPRKCLVSVFLSAVSRVPGFQLSNIATSLLIITHSKKGQAKGKEQTPKVNTHLHPSVLHKLTTCPPPQTLSRHSSPCCRQTTCPRSSPSPDWFRPWGAMATWQASRKWSHWWRASAQPSTCPAWCLSTTRPWDTSISETAKLTSPGQLVSFSYNKQKLQTLRSFWRFRHLAIYSFSDISRKLSLNLLHL